MLRYFTLALAALVLAGGALFLWLDGPAGEAPRPHSAPPPARAYVLALSWHPAFCEGRPDLPECRGEAAGDFAAGHLVLHGLWPQGGEYCGVSDALVALDAANRWNDLPPVAVGAATSQALLRLMPGARAGLERHEWLFHGTCSGVDADTYFTRAIALATAVNDSAVGGLLERSIGRSLSRSQIRAAFDTAFGDGAGRKVRLDCETDGERQLLGELRINLDGEVMADGPIEPLLAGARNAGSGGCSRGILDSAGAQ